MVEPRSGLPRQRTVESLQVRPAFALPSVTRERERFAVVKIRFEIPHHLYLYQFSHAHPEILIELTATQELSENRVLAELELFESNPVDHTEEMQSLPGVISVSRLGPIGPRTRYQGIAEKPSYLVLADELEVLFRYPRVVQNGEQTIEVASRVSQLRKLVDALRQLSPEVRVMAFGRDRMRTCPPSLTPQQDALLHQALAAGYFDVPRRISLTEFARKRGRSKSSTSRTIAIIEKELAQSALQRDRGPSRMS